MSHTVKGYALSLAITSILSSPYYEVLTRVYGVCRNSGLGDHGAKGLWDFIHSHTCNSICHNLQLASHDVLADTVRDHVQKSESGKARQRDGDHSEDWEDIFGLSDDDDE